MISQGEVFVGANSWRWEPQFDATKSSHADRFKQKVYCPLTCLILRHGSSSLVIPRHDIFNNLPLPYVEEEFKIDISWKDMIGNRSEPPPYVHIKRSIL
ncbi:hypothetical protein RND71_005592 [Anisodus tanguticus]|uniref:Uncharacterized protein n=1 Tax=Anisodus tanguticus TaxID=243964 RepID=A0AAE1SSB8_9SOLA|nr:hypothetical protein RND71_005592 [Anisodus tanguticus]